MRCNLVLFAHVTSPCSVDTLVDSWDLTLGGVTSRCVILRFGIFCGRRLADHRAWCITTYDFAVRTCLVNSSSRR
jgi:hypothetical protein